MTAEDFEEYLRSIGVAVETIMGDDGQPYTVVRGFAIPAGSLHGRTSDVAIHRVTTVPYAPPAAIHTNPALLPMTMDEPYKTQASPIGSEWQYWSRRFDRPPTPRGFWAHVLTVLCDDRWPV
jgi:E2/UBC family protein E